MDDLYYYAGRLGRLAALLTFSLLVVVFLSLERGIPPLYVWLGIAVFALAAYALVSFVVLTRLRPEADAADPSPDPATRAAGPQPYDTVRQMAGLWVDSTDWAGLARYTALPDAVLSREAVAQWVDQRFYSPRDGYPGASFPAVMCRLGAAQEIHVNGQPRRYIWRGEAGAILKTLAGQVTSARTSPALPTGEGRQA